MIVAIVILISLSLFGLAVSVAVHGYHEQVQQFDLDAAGRREQQQLCELEADATRQIQQLTDQAYDEMLTAAQRTRFTSHSHRGVKR